MDPRIIFQRPGRAPREYTYWTDSRRTIVQFLRTETFPWGGEVVGILLRALGVAMGTGLA